MTIHTPIGEIFFLRKRKEKWPKTAVGAYRLPKFPHSYRKGVAESNGDVRIISESSEIGVSAHVR